VAEHAGIGEQGDRPELADIGRMARRLVRLAVSAARAGDAPVPAMLREHLGPYAADLPVVGGSWRGYDHVNLQAGLDAWLAGPLREHELTGLAGLRNAGLGLADLLRPGAEAAEAAGIGVGGVAMTARPAGPAGLTRACVACGLYLVNDGGTRLALLLRGPGERDPDGDASLEVACADPAAARDVLDEVRRQAVARNVFRGHVVTFGEPVFGYPPAGGLLRFLERPRLDRAAVVLPAEVLGDIERQVLGVTRHAGRLRASGQHLRRGVLLHGAPGTGKTHTVRYLIGRLPAQTVVVLSGHALRWITEACSVARTLQPSVVVVEDVDLIAEEGGHRIAPHPMLFRLLAEMDGLGEDADVTFLLTTNRPDLLEAALAARPGRIDHAAELPVPDAEARRRLIALYQGGLTLDLTDLDGVIKRTDGVTAAFIKELLRRAALLAAEACAGPADAPLRVTDAHLGAALDQLLDPRGALTRTLLGGRGQDAVIRPMGADAVIRAWRA
jgi:hypothetical protein